MSAEGYRQLRQGLKSTLSQSKLKALLLFSSFLSCFRFLFPVFVFLFVAMGVWVGVVVSLTCACFRVGFVWACFEVLVVATLSCCVASLVRACWLLGLFLGWFVVGFTCAVLLVYWCCFVCICSAWSFVGFGFVRFVSANI